MHSFGNERKQKEKTVILNLFQDLFNLDRVA